MPRTPFDIPDAELAVMQQLWESGATTVRELTDVLYPGGSTSHYATVQKLLERLEAKECVRRDRDKWPHQFEATIAKEDLIERQLQNTADRLCDGALQPLLTHLVKAVSLSAEERESLRGLLEELDKGRKVKKK